MIMTPNKMLFCAAVLAMSMLPHVKAAAEDQPDQERGRVHQPSGVYYERQVGNECALHAVNCILHATGQNTTTPLVMEDAEPVERPEAQKGGNWSGEVIQTVLAASNIDYDVSIPDVINCAPNATAWVVNDGGHWHAYVKNAQQEWYNVESYRNFRWMGQTMQRNDEQWGPILVGDDNAMMQRIRLESLQGRNTYRVAHQGVQQIAQPAQEAGWMCACNTNNAPGNAFCLICFLDRPAQQNSTSATSPQASSPVLGEEEQKSNADPDAQTPAPVAGSPTATPQAPTYNPAPWTCPGCTYLNATSFDNCEMCYRPNPSVPVLASGHY